MPTTTRYRITYIFDATFSPAELEVWARRIAHQQIAGVLCPELVGFEMEHEQAPAPPPAPRPTLTEELGLRGDDPDVA